MCRFHSRVEYSDGQSVLLQICFLCLCKEGFQISLFPTNGSQVSRSLTFSISLLFTSMENRNENSLEIPGQYQERPLTEYEREPLASPLWNVQNKELVLISINLLARFPYFVLLWKLYWDFFNQLLFLISKFPFSPFLMTSMSLQRHSSFSFVFTKFAFVSNSFMTNILRSFSDNCYAITISLLPYVAHVFFIFCFFFLRFLIWCVDFYCIEGI